MSFTKMGNLCFARSHNSLHHLQDTFTTLGRRIASTVISVGFSLSLLAVDAVSDIADGAVAIYGRTDRNDGLRDLEPKWLRIY